MPFAPTDIANLWAWYNGDNVVITSGSLIDSLTDLSGNNRTATIMNALHKGSRVSAALNGHATIAEDGTNGSAYGTSVNFPTLDTNQMTVFVVAKKMSGDSNYSKFVYSNSGFEIGQGLSAANVGGESGNGSPATYAVAAAANNTFYTMRLRVTATDFYFSLNNGTETTATKGASFTAGPLTILGDISNKQIAAILVYTSNLTGNNSLEVEYFLNQLYNHYTWSGALPTSAQPTAVITFPTLPAKTTADSDFAPGATSTNTVTPITYASDNTSVATIVSGNIHIVGPGVANITASQAAGNGYNAATNVSRPLTVSSSSNNSNSSSMSFSLCGSIGANTGAIKCDRRRGIPKKIIVSGATFSPSDYASQSAFDAAFLATFKLPTGNSSKSYPFPEITGVTDKTDGNKESTLGAFGPKVILIEGKPGYEFDVLSTPSQEKQLRKFNGQQIPVFIVDDTGAVWGMKTPTGYFSGTDVLIHTTPHKFGDGQNGQTGKVSMSFVSTGDIYDAAAFLETDLGLSDMSGLLDVTLSLFSLVSNVVKVGIKIKSSSIANDINLADTYSTQLANATLWKATVVATGVAHTITSVAYDSVNKVWTVTLDSTQFGALASGAKVKIELKDPATLDSADVVGIESIALIITKP